MGVDPLHLVFQNAQQNVYVVEMTPQQAQQWAQQQGSQMGGGMGAWDVSHKIRACACAVHFFDKIPLQKRKLPGLPEQTNAFLI